MAVTAYLQQFLNEISKLPDNIRNSLYEITKLEQMTIFEDDSIEMTEIVGRIQKSTVDQVELDALEQLKQKLTKNLSCSAKKIDVINKLYNIVDQEVNRLDKDLKHFENETSANNPNSQSQHSSTTAISYSTHSNRIINHNNDITGSTTNSFDNLPNNDLELDLASGLNMPIDPNEPTYCLCHQVSYGNMVMCDNNKCPYEWFHFGCVGLVAQPKGKWYCAKCKTLKKHPSSKRRR